MQRRDLLKSVAAGAITLATPTVVRAQSSRLLKFISQADLASLDPVWTTADVTRNYSLAVFDTLYGLDESFQPQLQMLAGATTSPDGLTWELTLRDGLKFHDGEPVLARDCVASLNRFGRRDSLGMELMLRTAELAAPSDKLIRFRLKTPFGLLPTTLAQYGSAIMPERVAKTDAFTQMSEVVGSGPFSFNVKERISGHLAVFERFAGYVPRPDGKPSFSAGPKIVNFDRVEWQTPPDPATCAQALINKEVDWWENPTIDLIPSFARDKSIAVEVHDVTGEIGCLRFNQLFAPFNNAAIRRVVMKAVNQADFMQSVAGAVPKLIKNDVGIFVPGTPLASKDGVEATRGSTDYAALKAELIAAGYKGEKIVLLGATTIPSIYAIAQVTADMLTKMGFNLDFQTLEWGTVVQRRASKEPIDKGGWSIFMTFLGGAGNVSPGANTSLRGNGPGAWFGWPVDEKMEALRSSWFNAPDFAAQQKITAAMQAEYFQAVPYVALGMYDAPTAFHTNLVDIRMGYPQFYGVKRV